MMNKEQRVLGYTVEYAGKGIDITYKTMDNGDKVEVDHSELSELIKAKKVYRPKNLSTIEKLVYYCR